MADTLPRDASTCSDENARRTLVELLQSNRGWTSWKAVRPYLDGEGITLRDRLGARQTGGCKWLGKGPSQLGFRSPRPGERPAAPPGPGAATGDWDPKP